MQAVIFANDEFTVMIHEYLLYKYLHFVAVFMIVAALGIEAFTVKAVMTRACLRRLALIDAIYGAGAILLLFAGMMLWWKVGKPAAYYSNNYLFLLKIGLFALMGVLSLYPTVFFIKQRKGAQEEEVVVPRALRWCVYMELLLLLVIPLLAVLMAQGIGYLAS
jgi:putative membrane protein